MEKRDEKKGGETSKWNKKARKILLESSHRERIIFLEFGKQETINFFPRTAVKYSSRREWESRIYVSGPSPVEHSSSSSSVELGKRRDGNDGSLAFPMLMTFLW